MDGVGRSPWQRDHRRVVEEPAQALDREVECPLRALLGRDRVPAHHHEEEPRAHADDEEDVQQAERVEDGPLEEEEHAVTAQLVPAGVGRGRVGIIERSLWSLASLELILNNKFRARVCTYLFCDFVAL